MNVTILGSTKKKAFLKGLRAIRADDDGNMPSATAHAEDPIVLVDASNQADGSFPSVNGLEVGSMPILGFIMSLTNVTSVSFEGVNDLSKTWVNCTTGVVAESIDGQVGHIPSDFTAGAVAVDYSVVWRCRFKYFRITVVFSSGTNTIYADVYKAGS